MTFAFHRLRSAVLVRRHRRLRARASAEDRSIVVASTTSTQDSGLFGYLLPLFKAKTGIDVKVIAQGTGQALDTARRGDADVVFVHAKAQEEKFLAEGFGVKRFDVMYNDFVLIGPKRDPAGVKGKDIETALKAIQAKAAPFVSRGDRSGTHSAELALWKQAGIDIAASKGPWYREIGQGMGAALNTASAMNGYVLSDRGTWISFKNRGDLEIVGRRRQAAVQSIRRHAGESRKNIPTVKKELGQAFVDWLVSPEGQAAIAGYKIDGQQLFFPDAEKKGDEALRALSHVVPAKAWPSADGSDVEVLVELKVGPSIRRNECSGCQGDDAVTIAMIPTQRLPASLTPLDVALAALLRGLAPVAPIALPLAEALGCVAADMPPLHAHPPRDIAAGDGWALARPRSRRRVVLFAAAARDVAGLGRSRRLACRRAATA